MKIAVVGATGHVGLQVVNQALERGHEVVAYVRSPDTLPHHPGLSVVSGSLEDESALARAFTCADAVICCLGAGMRPAKPVELMQRSLPVVTAAMSTAGVDRFVLVSAFGVGDTAAKASPLARLLYRTVMAASFTDKQRSEQALPGSGLDWTIVHPVKLTQSAAGPAAAVQRLDQVARVPGLPTLSYASLASALLDIAATNTLTEQRVLVTTENGWK